MNVNQTIRNLFSRATMMLLATILIAMTAQTAWADTVILTEDTGEAANTAGRWYVNMPITGTNTLTLSDASVTTFKVYDDGGKGNSYSQNCRGYLVMTAPEGYMLQLSGSITTEKTWDHLTVYDGTDTGNYGIKLLEVSSTYDGTPSAISTVTSNGQSMALYFYSSDNNNYSGLDLTVTLITNPWSGSGSKEAPYIINTPADLDLLAQRVNAGVNYEGKYFKLGADIEYDKRTENNFTPIGNGTNHNQFYGTFDGDGKSISGININNSAAAYQGIFGNMGSIFGGTVKNLVVKNCIIVGRTSVGAIAGELQSGTIENCHVGNDVTLSGNAYAGGIVGASIGGTIQGCTSAATIKGTIYSGIKAVNLGGIVGATLTSSSSTLNDNIFTGAITGDLKEYIGAIVGQNENGTLKNNLYTSEGFGGIGGTNPTTGADGDGAYRAYNLTAGENVIVDFAGTATTYGSNGISAYTTGLKYANALYVGGTAPVSVLLSNSSDYPVLCYSASKGTLSGTATTGVKDEYTLTMDNAASTITVEFALWGEKDGADGSEKNPYIISTTAGLDKLAQKVNAGTNYEGKYFKLGADIKYDKNTENNFTPIGKTNYSFKGTFDGDGKTISGINIKSNSAEDQGIFGFVDGTVKNLVVKNCSIVGRNTVGAIAGKLRSGTIENCHIGNDVTLSGYMYIGGIVGASEEGTIQGCASAATIIGTESSGIKAVNLGGIVGATLTSSSPSMLTDNIFTGAITGKLKDYIGAIVGQNENGTLTNNLYTSTGFGGIGAKSSATGADGAGARKAVAISAAEGVTITPTGEEEAVTYDVSGITAYYDIDNTAIGYNSKLYAGATDKVNLSITYTVPTAYEFNKIDAGEGVTVTANEDTYTITMPTSDVTVKVVYKAIEYALQYNGIDQANFEKSNPAKYTIESDAITLNNPTREGYVFTGWTYEGQNTPTATVTIAKGSTGDMTFTANWKKVLKNTAITIAAIADQTYTGKALTPAVTVKDGDTDITDQCDLAYSDNINAGTAKVTITAKTTSTNYAGETTATFKIAAKAITANGITVAVIDDQTYTGSALTPAITVKDGDTDITDQCDFAYSDNISAGTAKVTITAKTTSTNYAGETTATFKIVAKAITADGITIADIADQTYTGSALTPAITVKDGDTDITNLCDFAYSDNISAGTAKVTITAKTTSTNYAGETTATFKIAAKTVDTPTIELSQTSYTYNTEALEPTVTVMDGSVLIDASEYTVSYEDNIEPGTATVIISDKEGGNYIVSGSAHFDIVFPILDENEPYDINGQTMFKISKESADAVKETIKADIALPAEAKGRVEWTVTGEMKFSKGSNIKMALTGLPAKARLKFAHKGLFRADAKKIQAFNVMRLKSRTRGDGDTPTTDGSLEIVSGVEYEVIEAGDLVLTIVLEDEEAILEGISVTEAEDDPDEPTEYETISISSALQVAYCSEYNLDFTDKPEMKAYVATGYDKAKGTIWLTRVKQVPANTGFLLMGEAGDYEVPVAESAADCYYKNMFKGTLEPITIQTTDGDYTNYYLSKGDYGVGFYKAGSSVGLKANRAYLSIPSDIPVAGSEGDTEVIKVGSALQVPYYTSKNLDFTTMDAKGVKAYTATGYNYKAGTIWLTRVKKVPANTGVLIMAGEAGDYSVPTASVASVYENMFVGSESAQTIYDKETIDGVDYVNYYLSKGDYGVGFYRAKSDGVKLGVNRCYLQVPYRASSGARGESRTVAPTWYNMVLSDEGDDVIAIPVYGGMGGDDGTTGIDVQSSIFNLQSSEVYYNLQGLRVDRPGKGVYIRNGKKVVIK